MVPTLSLDVLRAEQGDCLLLHHGDDVILIDGGPKGVFDSALKPRLEQLMSERPQPLFIRMVMVSHIDDDHIVGVADLFADAVERKEVNKGPPTWRAGELWLNAFGALTGAGPSVGAAGVRAAELEALGVAAPGFESQAVAASVKNGIALDADAQTLSVPRNTLFDGDLVQRTDAGATTRDVVPGLSFTVIAPSAKPVAKLRAAWEAWERQHPAKDVEAAANIDRSVFNLSSIVVLARSGERTLLLTGDARSDAILNGLQAAGLLSDGGPPLAVDLLKLPHHGSNRNVDQTFFDRVRARHYVVSANGRDGNPEDDTLRMLCDARLNDGEPWTVWLTYGSAPGDGKPGLHERLAAFFDARVKAGQKVDVRFGTDGAHQTVVL
jgi:Metallo-beta-lactamase superfamily